LVNRMSLMIEIIAWDRIKHVQIWCSPTFHCIGCLSLTDQLFKLQIILLSALCCVVDSKTAVHRLRLLLWADNEVDIVLYGKFRTYCHRVQPLLNHSLGSAPYLRSVLTTAAKTGCSDNGITVGAIPSAWPRNNKLSDLWGRRWCILKASLRYESNRSE